MRDNSVYCDQRNVSPEAQSQNETQIVSWLQGKGKGFMREGKQ